MFVHTFSDVVLSRPPFIWISLTRSGKQTNRRLYIEATTRMDIREMAEHVFQNTNIKFICHSNEVNPKQSSQINPGEQTSH